MAVKFNAQARLNMLATLCLITIIAIGGFATYLTRTNVELLKANHNGDTAQAVLISNIAAKAAESTVILQTTSSYFTATAPNGMQNTRAGSLPFAEDLISRLQKNVETTRGLWAQLAKTIQDGEIKAKVEKAAQEYIDLTNSSAIPTANALVADNNTSATSLIERLMKQQDQYSQQVKELQQTVFEALKISQTAIDQDNQRNLYLAVCLAAIITIVIAVFLLMSRLLTVYRGKIDSAVKAKLTDADLFKPQAPPIEPPVAQPSVIVSHPEIVQQLYSKMNGSIKLVSTVNIELMELNQEQKSLTNKVLEALPQLKQYLGEAENNATHMQAFGTEVSGVARSSDVSLKDMQSLLSQITEDARKMDSLASAIDAISLQSDMLAFNATLEAAKAGDFGRAFSVIASEVRLLAQKSMTATQDLKSVIHDISHRSSAHVERMNEAQTSLGRLTERSDEFVTAASAQLATQLSEMETLEFAELAYKRIEQSIDKQLQLFKDINGALGIDDPAAPEAATTSMMTSAQPAKDLVPPLTKPPSNMSPTNNKNDSDWALF